MIKVNKIIIRNIIFILIGAALGVFILQPVNDMVIYHLYEANDSSLSSWEFIFENLKLSISGESIKRTAYYMSVGAVFGLLMSFVSGVILSKINKINSLYDELSQDIELLVSHGEGPKIEFKSSFRWDLKESRANKSLESVVLKTIAGFMNGEGGSLLIGVADDGEILGIGPDYSLLKRQDSDGFEQAIMTVISTQLGTDLCQHVHILFHQINNKDICRLFIKKSQRPVYLNHKGSTKFYLRTGGGTRDMNIQEATEYIKRRWG